jgi:hypothetical protein
MYVWRIEKLKQSLVQEQVSDTEAMKYLIGFVCVNATPPSSHLPLLESTARDSQRCFYATDYHAQATLWSHNRGFHKASVHYS